MLKLYGTSTSRASRSLLALEELGLEYEHVPLKPRPGSPDREILQRLNPNAHIPVLEDDGWILWESMAINLYLGDRYRGPLWPETPDARALVYQWSLWGQTEIDRPDWNAVRRSGSEERIEGVRKAKVAALGILDRALTDRPYLLGSAFTLADLNLASTLSEPHENGRIDWQRLDPAELRLPALADWLARCTSRPSYLRVRALP